MNAFLSEAYFSSHWKGQRNLTSHFGTQHGSILYLQARANCLKAHVRIIDWTDHLSDHQDGGSLLVSATGPGGNLTDGSHSKHEMKPSRHRAAVLTLVPPLTSRAKSPNYLCRQKFSSGKHPTATTATLLVCSTCACSKEVTSLISKQDLLLIVEKKHKIKKKNEKKRLN